MEVPTDRLAAVQRKLGVIIREVDLPAPNLNKIRLRAQESAELIPHVDFLISIFSPVNNRYAPHPFNVAKMLGDGLTVDTTYTGSPLITTTAGGYVVSYSLSPFVGGRSKGTITFHGDTQHSYIWMRVQDGALIGDQLVEWVAS